MAVGITLFRHSWCDLNLRSGMAMWKGKEPVTVLSGEQYNFLICPSGPVALISARSLGYIIPTSVPLTGPGYFQYRVSGVSRCLTEVDTRSSLGPSSVILVGE